MTRFPDTPSVPAAVAVLEQIDARIADPGDPEAGVKLVARSSSAASQLTTAQRYTERGRKRHLGALRKTGSAAREEFDRSIEDFERVFERMYELSRRASFDIKSTAAPHYRRFVLQRLAAEDSANADGGAHPSPGRRESAIGRVRGVNDGNGFVFISHRGEIFPSGFLPLSAGNVRTHDLATVYRESELFTALRDPSRLAGKCGACEFKNICGGSRARAYALTGDYMESEPFCVYVPRGYSMKESGEEPARAAEI